MKIIVNENQFKRLILKETHGVTDMQNKEMMGKLAKEKERIDAKNPSKVEWKHCSADVKNHNGPVLVFFSRDYCSPCIKLKKMMDKNETFRDVVQGLNIMLLYMYCETPYWVRDQDDPQKCRSKKCSDGKTFHDDLIDTTTKFGGDANTDSGLLMSSPITVTDHDSTWDYKAQGGVWFTKKKKGGKDWISLYGNKEAYDKLNAKYPNHLRGNPNNNNKKWSGVPKLFITDSSFNKQIKLPSNIDGIIDELMSMDI